eukprot:Amastigsp_a512176_8.p2 type:complete len:303 gc:universal Amastigsp_a512176_8:759-1667(+)
MLRDRRPHRGKEHLFVGGRVRHRRSQRSLEQRGIVASVHGRARHGLAERRRDESGIVVALEPLWWSARKRLLDRGAQQRRLLRARGDRCLGKHVTEQGVVATVVAPRVCERLLDGHGVVERGLGGLGVRLRGHRRKHLRVRALRCLKPRHPEPYSKGRRVGIDDRVVVRAPMVREADRRQLGRGIAGMENVHGHRRVRVDLDRTTVELRDRLDLRMVAIDFELALCGHISVEVCRDKRDEMLAVRRDPVHGLLANQIVSLGIRPHLMRNRAEQTVAISIHWNNAESTLTPQCVLKVLLSFHA